MALESRKNRGFTWPIDHHQLHHIKPFTMVGGVANSDREKGRIEDEIRGKSPNELFNAQLLHLPTSKWDRSPVLYYIVLQ